ncbi:hypothetical protein BUALT_Bualt17G0095000 [Buddleja alternifolia]|uniref:SWIM-type domain-containing protein n=1 Tax=Buddleja alternifolia TaxID=168488 RepID=A0AAV6W7C2_9LAMI|nr:hypothetical protein BUALT_Bualt17G0095000 [Buddleja alternifolia]
MPLMRDPANNGLPPPEYDGNNNFLTLCVYYGGKFQNVPIAKYLGGTLYKFDYIDVDFVVMSGLDKLSLIFGIKGFKKYYVMLNNEFKLICNDKELGKILSDHIEKNLREVKLYIDHVGHEDGEEEDGGSEGVEEGYVGSEDGEDEDRGSDNGSMGSQGGEEGFEGQVQSKEKCKSKGKEPMEDSSSSEGSDYSMDSIAEGYEIEADEIDTVNLGANDNTCGVGNEGGVGNKTGVCKQGVGNEIGVGKEGGVGNISYVGNVIGVGNISGVGNVIGVDNVGGVGDYNSSGDEDILGNEDGFNSNKESDDEIGTSFPNFNPLQMLDPVFELGTIFSTKTEFRKAIHSHAIQTRRSIKVTKNDLKRVHGKCVSKGCQWRVHAIKIKDESSFIIREYFSKHTCGESYHVKNVSAEWLSERFVQKFKSDPKRNIKGFRQDAIEETRVHITHDQAYRAKQKSIRKLEGDPNEQFALLWDYAHEIRRTNPGSTVIIGTDQSTGENLFDRFYVCLQALKQGFLAGCRSLIGIDGCHLKGPHAGILLAAVGIDPNNNIYPIAYAVVNKESYNTWEWFLTLVKLDLGIERDSEYTLMSDKQKGLIQACNEVFPNSEHRFCVRHLHSNMKGAGFRGQAFKSALWNAALATTPNEFNRRMKQIDDLEPKLTAWLSDKPPEQWSKSHFNCLPKCDILLNNGCECFNSGILDARGKPILSMLEWIMEYLMKRMQINRDRAKLKWRGELCPKINKLIQKIAEKMSGCIPIKADDMHFQISCSGGTQFSVDLEKRTCGCRRWQLTGIPCIHAISAINFQMWHVEDFVEKCYYVETYHKAYEPVIMPVNGRDEWEHIDFIPPLPPNHGSQVVDPSPVLDLSQSANASQVVDQILKNDQTIASKAKAPILKEGPTMFQQFQQSHFPVVQQRPNIRASTPFTGIQVFPPKDPTPTSFPVVKKDGKKFVHLSNLAAVVSDANDQINKKKN